MEDGRFVIVDGVVTCAADGTLLELRHDGGGGQTLTCWRCGQAYSLSRLDQQQLRTALEWQQPGYQPTVL